MFKNGDKVVCIKHNTYVGITFGELELYKTYNILIDVYNDEVRLVERPGYIFIARRFILLTEYRKQKIERIKN
jgi:hypothetical protein